MKNMVVGFMFALALIGCGRPYSMYRSVEKCGVPVPVGPTNILAEGIQDLSSEFTLTSYDLHTQTFTSVSDPSCSFQTIDLVVQ